MKTSRKAALGAVAWLALWIALAFITTEMQNPDWSQRRKDRLHELYGEVAGVGMAGLGIWAFALYRKDR